MKARTFTTHRPSVPLRMLHSRFSAGFNCFHSSSSVSLRPQKTQQVRHIQEQANAGARAPRQPFRGGARGRGQLRGRSLQTTADVTTPPKNTSELNQKLTILEKNGNLSQALKIFKEAVDSNVRPNTASYTSILRTLARNSATDLMGQVVSDMKSKKLSPSAEVYDLLLSSYSDSGNIEQTVKWFHDMKQARVQPTIQTYNYVMKAYTKHGDSENVIKWFEEMKASGIEPDIISYGKILEAYAKKGQTEQMMSWFEQLKQQGLEVPVGTYNILMNGFARVPDLNKMMDIFNTMKQSGISPNSMTYQILVAAYKAAGNEAEVKKWTSECIEKGFSLRTAAPQKGGPANEKKDPRVAEFASLIQKKLFNEANAHWKELAADGRPSTYAYNLQLKSLRMQDKLQECMDLLETMEAKGAANEISYRTIISASLHAGDWSNAFKIIDNMKAKQLTITAEDFDPFFSFPIIQDTTNALAALEKMKSVNVQPSLKILQNLMSIMTLKNDANGLVGVFDTLVKAGYQPSIYQLNNIMSTFGKIGNVQQMVNWYNKLNEFSIKPDSNTFHVLIDRYSKRGNTKDMMSWFDKMREHGLAPKKATIVSMLGAFNKKSDTEGYAKVIEISHKLGIDWRKSTVEKEFPADETSNAEGQQQQAKEEL